MGDEGYQHADGPVLREIVLYPALLLILYSNPEADGRAIYLIYVIAVDRGTAGRGGGDGENRTIVRISGTSGNWKSIPEPCVWSSGRWWWA